MATDFIGLIPDLIALTKWLIEKSESFQQAPTVYSKLERLRRHHITSLEAQMELVKARQAHMGTSDLQEEAEALAKDLISELENTADYLYRCQPSGALAQLRWSLRAEKRALGFLDAVDAAQGRLATFLVLVSRTDKLGKADELGSILGTVNRETSLSIPGLRLTKGKAKYKPDQRNPSRDIDVILENVGTQWASDIAIPLGALAGGGSSTGTLIDTGMLSYLGHRGGKLLYRWPDNTEKIQTLQSFIAESQSIPLDVRFRLAHQLARALLRVHAVGMMHRRLRSDTILVLTPKVSQQGARHPESVPGQAAPGKPGVDAGPSGPPPGYEERAQVGSNGEANKQEKRPQSASGTLGRGREPSRRGSDRKNDKTEGSGKEVKRRNSFKKIGRKLSFRGDKKDQPNDRSTDGHDSRDDGGDAATPDAAPLLAQQVVEIPSENESVYLAGRDYLVKRGETAHRDLNPGDRFMHVHRHPGTLPGASPRLLDTASIRVDAYSLGVCLLEIGLGRVLIKTYLQDSQLRRRETNALRDITDRNLRDLSPQQLKDALVNAANGRLRDSMGKAYADLVVACLRWLEHDEEGREPGGYEQITAEHVKFEMAVNDVFGQVNLGGGPL